MADSQRKIEFQFAKNILETIADDFTCFSCQIVPRNGPIFQSGNGQTLCSSCKNSSHQHFHQVFGVGKILKKLPNFCKFKKNHCNAVLAPENLNYHEEDCDHRDVLCPFGFCKKNFPALKLDGHLKSQHGIKDQIITPQNQLEKNLKISVKIETNEEFFVKNDMWCTGIKNPKNLFFLNARTNISKKHLLIWFQIDGSKLETKNYICSIKAGPYIFKDFPHSLDEDKNSIFESDEGLVVPFGAVKKNVQENAFIFEVQIGGRKSENDAHKNSEAVELREIIMFKIVPTTKHIVTIQAYIRGFLARKQYLNRKNLMQIKVAKERFLRKDCSTIQRFQNTNYNNVYNSGYYERGIEAIRFKSDKNLIIGGFGILANRTIDIKIQLFDIGVNGGNQEVAGELVAENEAAYCDNSTLFKEPANITAQRWLVH